MASHEITLNEYSTAGAMLDSGHDGSSGPVRTRSAETAGGAAGYISGAPLFFQDMKQRRRQAIQAATDPEARRPFLFFVLRYSVRAFFIIVLNRARAHTRTRGIAPESV